MKTLNIFKVVVSTTALLALILFSPISWAGDITEYANNEWLVAGYDYYNTGSTEVVGVLPADPDGLPCETNNALSADKPPWTFTVGPEGAVLTVTDIWVMQDQYAVFDNGIHIGNTPEPNPGASCYDLPDLCIAYGGAGEFELGQGDHSITMTAIGDYVSLSCLFFRLDGDVGGATMEVSIDIQPNKLTNKIRLDDDRLVTVAIITTSDFNALTVDTTTVRFGPAGAIPIARSTRVKDVDRDGDKDYLFRFIISETGIQCGDTEATLTGQTLDGESIIGTDSFTTVRCY